MTAGRQEAPLHRPVSADCSRCKADGKDLRMGFAKVCSICRRQCNRVPSPLGYARAIGISSHDVVYRGVRRSCFMTQVRRLALAAVPLLAIVMVPLPYRPFT